VPCIALETQDGANGEDPKNITEDEGKKCGGWGGAGKICACQAWHLLPWVCLTLLG